MSNINLSTHWQEIEQIASARNGKNGSVNNYRFTSNKSDLQVHIEGVAGEMTFAIWSNTDLDRRTLPGGDGGRDFQFRGQRIEIKTRNAERYRCPDLLCRPNKADADIFVLCWLWPTQRRGQLMGWVKRHELMRRFVEIPKRGGRYMVKPSELHQMSTLGNYLRTINYTPAHPYEDNE